MKMFTNSVLLVVVLVSTLAGCKGDGEPADDAEREIPAVVVTQWNEATELFLEYPMRVAGKPTGNWAIHLSEMKGFKPVTEGKLTVRFSRPGAEPAVFTSDAPARAGIFLMDPVVPAPGTYSVYLILQSPQANSRHTLPEVRVFASEDEIPPEEEEEAAGGISFLKEQQWVIDWEIVPAAEQDMSRTIQAPAEIIPMDGAEALVSSPASGLADAASNRGAPSVGSFVRAGQVMAVLSPTSEDGGFARTRGELERLEREAERAKRLHDAGAIPRKRLEEAEHDLEVARAEARAMGGGPEADYRYRVKAPISGVVTERTFVPGGRISAGDPLFLIINPSAVWLRVRMPAAEASRLDRSTRATFTVEGSPERFRADRLVSTSSVVDPETRTVPVVFAVPNGNGALKIGQFAQADVPVGGTVRGVAIPTRAILDDGGIPVTYVQVGGETFERRRLQVGQTGGELTEVLSGVQPGEMVVTKGAYQVRLASMSDTPMSGGHAH